MTTKKQSASTRPGSRALPAPAPPYSLFARLYDECMDHVPYEQWSDYLDECARQWLGQGPWPTIDLACGTGRLLEWQRRKPGKLCGLDASAAMVERARQRLPGIRIEVDRLEELRAFRKGEFDRALCCHDSLNYLSPAQLQAHLGQVARILRPGGLYSTDLVTLSNMRDWFHGRLIRRSVGGLALRWSNRYSARSRELISTLHFRQASGEECREVHRQRYVAPEELVAAAEAAGLRLVVRHGDYEQRGPRLRDSLWNFHFRKGGPGAC